MLPYGIPGGFEDDHENFESLLDSRHNLKITVVPDITIGAGLNGEDFDSSLGPDLDRWFKDFRETYNKCKRTPATQQKLQVVLMRDPEPLKTALKLFASSPGCNYLKNKNMALYILETVCELYKQYPDIAATCDDNTRMVAFNFVKTCGVTLLYKAVTETYQLQKIQNYLIPKLQMLLKNNFYRDATYWSIFLNCTHIFGVFDLVFPLILQDKTFLAEEFLNVAKEQQLPTVQFLDSLLDRKKTVYENCDEILKSYKYSDVKHNVLSYRPMSKLVTRLANKYNIDPKYTPKLKYSKSCSYMHYLFHKYEEGSMSCESWRELAREEANKSKALQLDLITKITTAGNLEEAMYWAEFYQISPEECPLTLQMKMLNHAEVKDTNNDINNSWDSASDTTTSAATTRKYKSSSNVASAALWHKDDYLSLQLPASAIVLVDTKPQFLEMLEYLEKFLLIGFDSEWKPSMNNDTRVSLIQLATQERVYLVDCLSEHLDERLWKMMGSRIFNNLEILKLGFSLHYDMQMLHKSLPLQMNLQASSCYLDLRDLWRRLKYMQISAFPYEQNSVAGEGLCALTEMCLGKKLDKSNQCSNWANRPLRQDQITYAALDAHCLLQIYQVLTDVLQRLDIDINVLVEDITTSNSGNLFRTKSKMNAPTQNVGNLSQWGQHNQKGGKERSSNLPLKFLCDSMLLGLSRELRKLGLNSLDMDDNNDMTYYIDLARKEERIVLTRDSRYMEFARELNKEQCIQIPIDVIENQVLHILQNFQIQIETGHLNSRCIKCNGNDFILANRFDMQLMRYGQLQQPDDGTLAHANGAAEKLWNLKKINSHIIKTRKTFSGKNIKLKNIQVHSFYKKDFFYICDSCGFCSWNGENHLSPAIKEFLGLPFANSSPTVSTLAAPQRFTNTTNSNNPCK